ncbi:MAG: hypothetical protein M3Q56_05470 [Bacteroidota bacterium]|nr:hypothetical protein [Bacteroidota bacterium]
MPHRFFLIPVAIIFAIFLYFNYNDLENKMWQILLFTILIIALFVFRQLIDEKWYHYFRPKLGEKDRSMIPMVLPYTKNLADPIKELFYEQMSYELTRMHIINKDSSVGGSALSFTSDSQIPEEIKWMSLGPGILFNILTDKPITENYSRYVYYTHPFLTPDIQHIHICESHDSDGVIIFSLEQLQASHLNPGRFFNPAVYEWSGIIFRNYFNNVSLILDNEESWDKLKRIIPFDKEWIENYLGHKPLGIFQMLLYAFIMHPQSLKMEFSEGFNIVESRFKSNVYNFNFSV